MTSWMEVGSTRSQMQRLVRAPHLGVCRGQTHSCLELETLRALYEGFHTALLRLLVNRIQEIP